MDNNAMDTPQTDFFYIWNALRVQMSGLPWTVSPNYVASTYQQLFSTDTSANVPFQAEQAPIETKFVRVLDDKSIKRFSKPGDEGKINKDEDKESKNKAKLNMISTNKRTIVLQKFKTKREELLKAKKPVCTYKATILKTWKPGDFAKQTMVFKKRMAEEREKEGQVPRMEEGPTLLPAQGRVVSMQELSVGVLKSAMTPQQRCDRWYIVADTRVLLEDYFFMDKLARSDRHCRIRLPYEVLHDLVQMTDKKQASWMRIPAKRLANYIHHNCARNKLVIGQTAMEAEDLEDHPFAVDMVLNLCMQLLKKYYYVVLISNDPERKQKASSLNLPCYTLSEVQTLVAPKFFNYKESNIKITCTATTTHEG